MTINRTKPAIEQLEELVRDVPGWSPIDQLYTLFTLALSSADLQGDIVEVGWWCGRSAVILGAAAQLQRNTRVHCVDLFPAREDWQENPDGTYSMEVEIAGKIHHAYAEQTVWKEPYETQTSVIYEKHADVFTYFMETVNNAGMQTCIEPHRGDTRSFVTSRSADFRCKLAFLDGDHGYAAVCEDIRNLEPLLVAGGWICFDDAFSSYAGVDQAVTELIIDNPAFESCQQMTRKLFVARKQLEQH